MAVHASRSQPDTPTEWALRERLRALRESLPPSLLAARTPPGDGDEQDDNAAAVRSLRARLAGVLSQWASSVARAPRPPPCDDDEEARAVTPVADAPVCGRGRDLRWPSLPPGASPLLLADALAAEAAKAAASADSPSAWLLRLSSLPRGQSLLFTADPLGPQPPPPEAAQRRPRRWRSAEARTPRLSPADEGTGRLRLGRSLSAGRGRRGGERRRAAS